MRVALIALLLTGCQHAFTEEHYKKASETCLANGGLSSATIGDSGKMGVRCKNGAYFYEVAIK